MGTGRAVAARRGGRVTALADILELTRNMFAAAHSGDFDRVAALDAERRAALEAGLCAEADAATLIDAIVASDREIAAETGTMRLEALFPKRLYVEVVRRLDEIEGKAEPKLLELAYARDLPLVATNPC
jgi:DNA polymerase III alpha subunit